MFHIKKIMSALYVHCLELRWYIASLIVFAHFTLSFAGLAMAGEAVTEDLNTFMYFYMTTITTVGYGDFSPTTGLGRAFHTWIVMPGGLMVYAMLLGKIIGALTDALHRKARGMSDLSSMKDHVVIVGYHGDRTTALVEELKASSSELNSVAIVLVAAKETAPSSLWTLVKTESLSSQRELYRAGVASASKVIAFGDDDDITITSVMAVRGLNPTVPIVSYFSDREKASLIQGHCSVKVITSPSIEMIAREASHPGSADILMDIMTAQDGVSMYSLTVSENMAPLEATRLKEVLVDKYGATLMAVKNAGGEDLVFDQRQINILGPGDEVFYFGATQIDNSLNLAVAR